MEIYNERMERMESADLTRGWMEESVRHRHHEAQEAVREEWHYETIAQYSNGGKDVRRGIDVKGQPAREAWDEEIAIQIYHPYAQDMPQEQTLEERMERLEAAMNTLKGAVETIGAQWAQMRAAKGAE